MSKDILDEQCSFYDKNKCCVGTFKENLFENE